MRPVTIWQLRCALLLPFAGAVAAQEPAVSKPRSPADKIAYYHRQVTEHPKHYPAYARLGREWLDRARQTYDPAALAEARKALARSLEIQPNYEALCDLAATANYAHRFEEALRWCTQAADAAPQDTSVLAMRVEALLALGRAEEARSLLGKLDEPAKDLYTSAARAHWHASQGNRDQAAACFQQAARLAQEQKVRALAVWATVSAAGVWLDAGNLTAAKPLLDAATKLDPADAFLKIHCAELAVAESRPAEALQTYEGLLRDQTDPELQRRAFILARELGQQEAANGHRDAAEQLCRRAIDAGEFYGLEALAQLYCDSDRPAEAMRLAELNLQHKHDAAAKETRARARQLMDR